MIPLDQEATRDETEHCNDGHLCSDYEHSPSLEVIHEECQQNATIMQMLEEADGTVEMRSFIWK